MTEAVAPRRYYLGNAKFMAIAAATAAEQPEEAIARLRQEIDQMRAGLKMQQLLVRSRQLPPTPRRNKPSSPRHNSPWNAATAHLIAAGRRGLA